MPEPSTVALWVVLALLVVFTGVAISRAIRIVPQATAVIVQRLGRYHRTLDAGLHFLIPFIDKVRATVDLREQVVSFPPQPVITSDNLVVSIDTVIYFQPTDPKAAVYEIANYIQGIEQLTVTTLRNVIGSLDLEQTLTSRDQINGQLRGVLDDATGRWGIRVNRVELKAIDPPASVQDSMEKQMRAERDRRAAILNAEGVKQSQILTAEGEKQAQILRAEGTAQAAILEAQGEAKAILRVFDAIHTGNPDSKLLAYQYLQMLPQIAQGESNKMWIVPTELTQALQGIGAALGPHGPSGTGSLDGPPVGTAGGFDHADEVEVDEPSLEDPAKALARARREAAGAAKEAEESTRAARRRGLGASQPGPGPTEPGPAPAAEPEMPDEPTE
ncbi:SPFH/Band 7/PHB domain protein [Ornithinimicrobium sp. F0845]|uniref:SPFH domain-containing protein n=1 Tax=Ornithinimicrobium sp. F0845 TaxID=2926412 RepID=UPI001FF1D32A|nr:SPFH domain-containing protein [Ornithinimicrobium sp. F0845]MCK0110616.1 SPFH/Band 7/PHB domain protein [Ornithinimicrobium sp. F0845]